MIKRIAFIVFVVELGNTFAFKSNRMEWQKERNRETERDCFSKRKLQSDQSMQINADFETSFSLDNYLIIARTII